MPVDGHHGIQIDRLVVADAGWDIYSLGGLNIYRETATSPWGPALISEEIVEVSEEESEVVALGAGVLKSSVESGAGVSATPLVGSSDDIG